MRRAHLEQLIPHSFTHRMALAPSPYAPQTRYSALLNSSDRLLFAHPDPATRAPSPTSPIPPTSPTRTLASSRKSSTNMLGANDRVDMHKARRSRTPKTPILAPECSSSAPKLIRCTHCTRRLGSHEYPECLPTTRCRHENATCVYCLHNSVYNAYARGKWGVASCLICGQDMSEGEMGRLVLLWEEEGVGE